MANVKKISVGGTEYNVREDIADDGLTVSTTEHVIGKWVDGKNIYERYMEVTGGDWVASGGGRYSSTTSIFTNNETIIDIIGSVECNDGGGHISTVMFGSTTLAYNGSIAITSSFSTPNILYVGSTGSWVGALPIFRISVRYIKTTE